MAKGHDRTRRSVALLEKLEIARAEEVERVESLTGGVSSEIDLVTLPNRLVCTKFALAKLQVEADWFAPVHRNFAEYRWLEMAAKLAPGNVPMLFGYSDELGGFAMSYIGGTSVRNWKAKLLEGLIEDADILSVARTLAVVHAGSCKAATSGIFDNREDFEALRIEPYFLALISEYPGIATKINAVVASLRSRGGVVIHGDISPKNILLSSEIPIFLDAECATVGDPAFDVAFCLNHLLLKSIHLEGLRGIFLTGARRFADTYLSLVDWENRVALDARIARLLPILLLARVDGKSPVEYLSARGRNEVRKRALRLVELATDTTAELFDKMQEKSV